MDYNKLLEENKALRNEITRLRRILDAHHINYQIQRYFPQKEEYDLEDARILNKYIKGRRDVYAKRVINKQGGTSYYPQCHNFYKDCCPKKLKAEGRIKENIPCNQCNYKNFILMNEKVYIDHLNGKAVYGIYPLLSDNTTYLIGFDFDDHNNYKDYANIDNGWMEEVNALRTICDIEKISCLVERSRSGHGAHVWIIFEKAIEASLARKFGNGLLTIGAKYIDLKEFNTYDRMLPMQDSLHDHQIGNLIALPFQGKSVKEGNTVFVDEHWNPYPDQWGKLQAYVKIKESYVKEKIESWGLQDNLGQFALDTLDDEPWKTPTSYFNQEDIQGIMHITFANGLYIDTKNIKPRMANQVRRMAAFKNTQYYKQCLQSKNEWYYNFHRIIDVHTEGKDYIEIPRGLLEQLIHYLEDSNIEYEINDQKVSGKPIDVEFNGTLYTRQQVATNRMLNHDMGILQAATGSGKTVMGTAMIASLKVSTLIIVKTTPVFNQWIDTLNKFVTINEELPTYFTEKGKEKRRKSCIGTLRNGVNKLTGIIDVAMVSSIKERIYPSLDQYGMVLFDECHHCVNDTSQEVLSHVRSHYVYGMSATPKNDDGLTPILGFTFGPIRYKYTSFERAFEQSFNHSIYPRFTSVTSQKEKMDLQEAYQLIKLNKGRQEMIVNDVVQTIAMKHTPLVLVKFVDQAKDFYERLKTKADPVFLLIGKVKEKERNEIFTELQSISDEESIILIATIQLAGEGFDFPRADTIMLATPISYTVQTEQVIGRITRDYEGKQSSIVYDYIDIHIPVFERMYRKRMTTYKKNGFSIVSKQYVPTKDVQSFYDQDNYALTYDDDLSKANESIMISSPTLAKKVVLYYIHLLKLVMERGVLVTVLCLEPDCCLENQQARQENYIALLKQAGINVYPKKSLAIRYCVIDHELIWYGDMNLLSNVKKDQMMLRYMDARSANELLELTKEG